MLNVKVLPVGTGVSEESTGQGEPKQIGVFKKRGCKLVIIIELGPLVELLKLAQLWDKGNALASL